MSLQKHLERSNPHIWPLSAEGRRQVREQFLAWLFDKNAKIVLAVDDKDQAIGMAVGKLYHHKQYVPPISCSIAVMFVKRE